MKYIFALAIIAATCAHATEMKSVRSGGQYEADLRNHGTPISTGLTFDQKAEAKKVEAEKQKVEKEKQDKK